VRIAQETRHKFCVKTLEFVEVRERQNNWWIALLLKFEFAPSKQIF
jgi:hypothetical protein